MLGLVRDGGGLRHARVGSGRGVFQGLRSEQPRYGS